MKLVLGLFAIFLLAACNQSRPTAPSTPKSDRVTFDVTVNDVHDLETLGVTQGNGITVTFEKTADWDAGGGKRGFTANITLLNQTNEPINDWDLGFAFPYAIDQAWGAKVSTASAAASLINPDAVAGFKLVPESWNAKLAHNQSRSFGFMGSYSGAFVEPSAYVLSGVPIGEQGPVVPPVVACNLETRFQVNSSWENGGGTKGFVAELYLTNVGSQPVDWSLDFDFDGVSILNMWNADFVQDEASFAITPASWNTRLEPGATTQFGFQGVYEGNLDEPQNIVCNKGKKSDVPALPEGPQALNPGGSITFANGFTFDASRASLDKQLEVSINVLEDTSDLIPHETVLQPVSPHYKLTSSEDFLSLPDPFVITMPLPEGVSPDGLRVAWLVDGQDIVHNYNDPDAPDEWTESPLTYLPETNEVAFTRIRLHEKGQVFVLIQRDDTGEQQGSRQTPIATLQVNNSNATFTAVCSPRFKEGSCGRNQTNYIARIFRESFKNFQDLGYPTPALEPDKDGNYYITILPAPGDSEAGDSEPGDSKVGAYYLNEEIFVYISEDGSASSSLAPIVTHELGHAFQNGYPSINQHPNSAGGAYFREGLASIGAASPYNLEPSIALHGGHRPLDISLFAPPIADSNDPRAFYPYQAQEFWGSLAKNSGANDIGFFKQFLAPTGNAAIDALPAWDPKRVDHVIKNLDGDPFPGGLGDAYQQYVNDRLAAIIKNGERLEDNFSKINELETPDAEGLKISAEGIDPLSTRVFRFPISKGKTGADFLLLDSIDGANVRTYTQDGYYYILVTNTSYDTLPTGVVSASSKAVVEPDVIGPANSHGEPHLRTFDFIGYDFQAIGEYVFTRSTLPEDDFEVQVRYIPVTIGEGSRGEKVSVAGAAAIRQFGDLLEVYAVSGGGLEVYVNAQEVTAFPSEQGVFTISKQSGFKQGGQQTVVVTTPDGKSLKFRGFKSRNASYFTPLISDIQVVLPALYEGNIEGLLGNANSDRNDDLQLRDGTLLPLNTKDSFLYFGDDPRAYLAGPGGDTYRDSWSLFYGASPERFLRLGGDPFSRTYPRNVVTLKDLPEEEVEAAKQACIDGGIRDAWALRSCTFDVALTGDDSWIEVAKGVDLFLPSISLTPAYRFAGVDAGPFEVNALAYENGFQVGADEIEWLLDGPDVSTQDLSIDSYSVSFLALGGPGIYTVTAKLRSNGDVFETSTFELVPGKLPSVANDDSIVTSWNMTSFFSVLFNDDNPDGRPSDLIIVEVTQPENGTAEISSDGKRVIYNPDPNYFGTDTLTYTIENGDGTRSTGTIRIRIDSFFAS